MTPSQTLEEAEKALVAFRARGLAIIGARQPSPTPEFFTDAEAEIQAINFLEGRLREVRLELQRLLISVARSRELPF